MSLYLIALVTHVLVAILGLGSVVSVALMAATVQANRPRRGRSRGVDPSLAPASAFSLAVMLMSGVVMVSVAGGGFHGAWWLRLSVLLLVVTGALHARARRALRKEPANDRRGASSPSGGSSGSPTGCPC